MLVSNEAAREKIQTIKYDGSWNYDITFADGNETHYKGSGSWTIKKDWFLTDTTVHIKESKGGPGSEMKERVALRERNVLNNKYYAYWSIRGKKAYQFLHDSMDQMVEQSKAMAQGSTPKNILKFAFGNFNRDLREIITVTKDQGVWRATPHTQGFPVQAFYYRTIQIIGRGKQTAQ